MQIHVNLYDEDYIQYNIHHSYYSYNSKKTHMIGRLSPFLFSIVFIAVFIYLNVEPLLLYVEIAVLMLYSIISFIRYPKSLEKRIRKYVLRMKEEGKLPYDEEAMIDFGEDVITETTPNMTNRISYSEIRDVCETEGYIYLIIGAMQAIILPKRCLDDKFKLLGLLKEKCRCKTPE